METGVTIANPGPTSGSFGGALKIQTPSGAEHGPEGVSLSTLICPNSLVGFKGRRPSRPLRRNFLTGGEGFDENRSLNPLVVERCQDAPLGKGRDASREKRFLPGAFLF